jgi:hypothetical protein
MPRTERGSRSVLDRCSSARTEDGVVSDSRSSTLRSKSTSTGHRSTTGKLPAAASGQDGSAHRNASLRGTTELPQRGQRSSGSTSRNAATAMPHPAEERSSRPIRPAPYPQRRGAARRDPGSRRP